MDAGHFSDLLLVGVQEPLIGGREKTFPACNLTGFFFLLRVVASANRENDMRQLILAANNAQAKLVTGPPLFVANSLCNIYYFFMSCKNIHNDACAGFAISSSKLAKCSCLNFKSKRKNSCHSVDEQFVLVDSSSSRRSNALAGASVHSLCRM